MRFSSRRFRTALVATALGACAGCRGPDAPPTSAVTYVGTLDGTDAVVAVVVQDGHAAAYVCGGSSSFATLTHWFTGDVGASGAVDLAAGGYALHAAIEGDAATGTVLDPAGVGHGFSAHAPAAGTLAGLYVATDMDCRTGVVVQQASASDAPSVQGTWCALASGVLQFEQVTPIAPVALMDDGLRVRVQLATEVRDLVVTPVAFPLR